MGRLSCHACVQGGRPDSVIRAATEPRSKRNSSFREIKQMKNKEALARSCHSLNSLGTPEATATVCKLLPTELRSA